ncbi:transcriptional regulator, AraC family [Solidesulfovibrio carbinoliphilus subsp. oakridgensis]|uniref:Transcriptional regulator, AraC family n=1 Tax=Solidesulfovibrio carbinoliphilus subsp. oakridgensis TaxID=694327 RepID=G7Q7Y9_9BACT|nr:helix-turn-helix transcriptional regulator [Solidesulfovibrio carbinoliphilus]EHJ47683.1 transcriptional regulator, AraC family [Solidesulfovibrio carbinoliphilus subsp. oakridgensis]
MAIFRTAPALDRLPRPVYPRSETLPAGSVSHAHSHPFGQLSFAGVGVLLVRTQAGSHVAPPQRAVWVPPGLAHQVATSNPAEMRSLYVSPDQNVFNPPRCLVLSVTPLARELILAVAALPPLYDAAGADGRLVAVLLDQLAVLPEAGFSLPWPKDPRLAALCQALADAPDDTRTATAWARTAGMTERTLGRIFLAETGLTFGAWRRRTRLLAALSLLEAGTSVTATGLECGYESTSAFIAAFREAFGVTPGAFGRGV